MAVVWQNTFDGPIGNNLTPINSANYGNPILDNQRNGNPANAVRYGNRAYMGNSSMQLGLQDGSGHGDTWVYSPSVNAYSLSFYLYLTQGGWFRFRDANNVSELYFATASQSVVVNQNFNQESEMFDRWVRVEFIVSPSELGIRIWWTDPDSTGTPDYEYIIARAGGTVGNLLCQGGSGENVYVDQVQIGEGEWIGPWPGVDHTTTAEITAETSGTASATTTRAQDSDASTVVSGTAAASRESGGTADGSTGVTGGVQTSSDRAAQASLDVVTDGTADGYPGLPPQRGIGSVGVDSEASASTQRIGSATLDTEVSTQSSYQRQSPNTAEGSLEVSSDAYGTKTAQPSLTDTMHMSGLVGADKREDLVFPIQLHVELDIPGNSWVDITADVRATEPVVITRGRANEAQHPDTSTMTLKLNNRHGKYSPRNPNSPYYGRIGRNTPIRVYVTQGDIVMSRFIGEVSEWPPRWDISDTDVWINLEASGLLRRLEQGSQPLSSAYKQLVTQSNAVIYWPLDNGPESGFQATSEIGQSDFSFLLRSGALGTTLALTRPPWQDADPAPWLEPMVRTVGVRGLAQGDLDSPLSAPWGVDWIRYGLGGHDAMQLIARDGDTTDRWFVGEDPTVSPRGFFVSIRREIDEGNTSITMLDEFDIPTAFLDDNPHHMRFTVEPTGATSLAWTLYGDGVVIASGTRTGTAIRPLVGVRYEWWVPDDGGFSQHLAFGQISAFPLDGAHTAAQATTAMRGYNYERAGRRIERLCGEFGVALEVSGDLDDTPVMGPQRIDDFVTLLRQAADVDQGYLMESRQTNALLYRTNRSRYSQEDVS